MKMGFFKLFEWQGTLKKSPFGALIYNNIIKYNIIYEKKETFC